MSDTADATPTQAPLTIQQAGVGPIPPGGGGGGLSARLRPIGAPLLVVALVLAFAFTTESSYRFNLATLAGIYAIAAIALTLLFGGAGQLSLGHAGFVGTGAWVTGVVTADYNWPFPVAALLSIIVAGIVGVVLGYAALRVEGHYLALATLAFGLLFAEFMDTVFPNGLFAIPPPDLFFVEFGTARSLFLAVWAVTIAVYVLVQSLARSRFGRSLVALRDDQLAAASCGVDIARTKIAVFSISAALGGLAGALFAPYQASITDESFGFFLSVNLLIMAVIGGLGSPLGAIAAVLFLAVVPELGREYERVRLLGFGVALILAIVLFPGGFAGMARRARRAVSQRSGR